MLHRSQVARVTISHTPLKIFFPRSIEREAGYRPRRRSLAQNGAHEEISMQTIGGEETGIQQPQFRRHYSSVNYPTSQIQTQVNLSLTPQSTSIHEVPVNQSLSHKPPVLLRDDSDFRVYPAEPLVPPTFRNDSGRQLQTDIMPKRQEMWEMLDTNGQPYTTLSPRAGMSGALYNLPSSLGYNVEQSGSTGDLHPLAMNYVRAGVSSLTNWICTNSLLIFVYC